MAVNLERGTYNLGAKDHDPQPMPGTVGWYGIPTEFVQGNGPQSREQPMRVEWHWARLFAAPQGRFAGVPTAIEYCQGEAAYHHGQGAGSVYWHGPLQSPRPSDFAASVEQTVCETCWQAHLNGDIKS